MITQTVLITGTSTGFGKLATKALSSGGFQVIATMREVDGKNAEPAKELSALPGVEVVELDVTSDYSVSNAMNYINQKYPVIDVLINNAGVAGGGLLEAYDIADFKQMFEINVFGVVRMYHAVLPSMRAVEKGLVINFSSLLGFFALPYLVPYSASKFALEAINEGLQAELKQFNIENVNLVIGAHPTEMNTGAKSGIGATKANIAEAYGRVAQDGFNAIGEFISSNMHRNELQKVVDTILELIKMREGTRPLRVAIDEIAEGTDKHFIETAYRLRNKWAEKYQVTLPE